MTSRLSVKHPGDPLAAKRNDEVGLGAAGVFSQILADRHPPASAARRTLTATRGSTGRALTEDPHRLHLSADGQRRSGALDIPWFIVLLPASQNVLEQLSFHVYSVPSTRCPCI